MISLDKYIVIKKLPKALSNSVQLIKFDNKRKLYVLRTNSKINNEALDRESEKSITTIMVASNLTPPTFFENEFKYSEYMEGSVSEAESVLNQLILLSRLHRMNIQLPYDFSPVSLAKNYSNIFHKKIKESSPIVNELVSRIKFLSDSVSKSFINQYGSLVPCHIDAIANNMVYKDRIPYLIDFEYSGNYALEFDLATVLLDRNENMEPGYSEYIIGNYQVLTKTLVDQSRLSWSYEMICLLWYIWSLAYYAYYRKLEFLDTANYYIDSLSKSHSELFSGAINDLEEKMGALVDALVDLHNQIGDSNNE